jgi:hypothetical protein
MMDTSEDIFFAWKRKTKNENEYYSARKYRLTILFSRKICGLSRS